MHEYDVSLKLLLMGSSPGILRSLTGLDVNKWLNVEMPEVRNTRVDLLGETAAGELIHIELQSTNDKTMALRMLEYSVRIYRLFGRFPRQVLLYVGEPALRMETDLVGARLSFSFEIFDMRDFDGEPLLQSSKTGDNVIAVLARLRDKRQSVRRILGKIAKLKQTDRDTAFQHLMTLAGLRGLAGFVEEESRKMPILDDIMDHEVIGRERKLGIAIGREEGFHEGELKILRRLIEKRFGTIPVWAEKYLQQCSESDLEAIGLCLLDALTLQDLFPSETGPL